MERFLSDLFPQLDDPEEFGQPKQPFSSGATQQGWNYDARLQLPPSSSCCSTASLASSWSVLSRRLAFNHSFVPEGLAVADWLACPDGGVALVSSFLDAWM